MWEIVLVMCATIEYAQFEIKVIAVDAGSQSWQKLTQTFQYNLFTEATANSHIFNNETEIPSFQSIQQRAFTFV